MPDPTSDAVQGNEERRSGWTFLSNHAHVLFELARDPSARLRDLSERVGITERAVHRIVAELEEAHALTRERVGRRNHYTIDRGLHLRHPVEQHCTIGDLIEMVMSAHPNERPKG